MRQISLHEADDLLAKLLSDRVPLTAFFMFPNGVRLQIPVFLDSKTEKRPIMGVQFLERKVPGYAHWFRPGNYRLRAT